jgi:Rieske Fe-S protein
MMKCDMCYDRSSVGQGAHVRHGLPEPGALLRHARADPGDASAAVDAGRPLPLRRPDDHHVFAYPDEHDTCLLVRAGEDEFLAYSNKCSHLSCAVTPDVSSGRLLCPCHHGSFDLATGRPLAGPPRRPLARIVLEVRDGTIYATGVEERTV